VDANGSEQKVEWDENFRRGEEGVDSGMKDDAAIDQSLDDVSRIFRFPLLWCF